MDTLSSLSEGEIQVLIVLIELCQPKETPNNNHYTFHPKTVEEAATYFKVARVDWTTAYVTLQQKGLITPVAGGYALTPNGKALANQVRDARPPIFYWYEQYYALAPASHAYQQFCEEVYGRFLCQTNFSDMAQIGQLIDVLQLTSGQHCLDIGCGVGLITEYLSDQTGASFVGIDYSPTAIRQAQQRSAAKRHRLTFREMNMDTLDFAERSFDAIVSIDTLYMPKDLDATVSRLMNLLRPGGKLAIFWLEMLWNQTMNRASLAACNTSVAQALQRNRLTFQSWDFSAPTYRQMQRKPEVGSRLKDAFIKEGNAALYHYVMAESLSDPAPYTTSSSPISRYLYLVRKEG
jgi:2-polyprenyl-3-methyl-5-hydroxy-6-metoxy-1,4-benzoquinol methylase